MIILVPMGGKGSRFIQAGYATNKACILTTDRHTGDKLPMVVCAMKDIPGINDPANKIVCVDRDFHETDGTEQTIRSFFPNTVFVHDTILLDQAYGCYLAKDHLKNDEELFIGTCDSGLIYDKILFDQYRKEFDVLMIGHSGDDNIEHNPNAHSWAKLKPDGRELAGISLKQTLGQNFMHDHATTGMFWFKKARDFLVQLEEMIVRKDTFDGKYYVDKVLQYCIDSGLRVGHFDVKYICWGTPFDYEKYENTLIYWKEFLKREDSI